MIKVAATQGGEGERNEERRHLADDYLEEESPDEEPQIVEGRLGRNNWRERVRSTYREII